MIVVLPSVFMFEKPDILSPVADEVLFGIKCEILDECGAFYKIKTDYGYCGWAQKSAFGEELTAPNMRVVSGFADLIPENEFSRLPVMTLPRGALLDVGFSHIEDRFGFAVLPSKRVYYIHKTHIAPITEVPKTEEEFRKSVCDTALSYLGTQYRWGGMTDAGIDCSGLCFMCYRQNGKTIWRDADFEKNQILREIAKDEMKPADLIFFDGHIALYYGNGEIIHSSGKAGKVIKEQLAGSGLENRILHIGTAF